MVAFHLGYLDPGSGSIIVQAAIGGFLGFAYVGRRFIQRALQSVKSLVTAKSSADTKNLGARDKLS